MANKPVYPHCQLCSARQLSVFNKLKDEELQELDEHKGCGFYRKNQIIFSEDSHANGLYCINKGKIKVYQSTPEGRDQIIRFAKEGDVMGYRALLSGESFSASAMALDDATICFIPQQKLMELMERNTELGMKFMRLLCHNLEDAQDQMVNISYKNVRERVAEVLLLLKETFGTEEDGETLDVRLTREDIASYVGTATESAIRMLSEFNKDGLIELKGKRIKLTDLPGLLRLARVND